MPDFDLLDKAKKAREQAAAAAAKAAEIAGQAGARASDAAAKAAEIAGQASAKASDAASAAADLAGQASARASDLRVSVAATAAGVKDTLAMAASDLRDASASMIKETIADFNASLPVLREMGYSLEGAAITLGMPPSMQATFLVAHDVADDAIARALEENAERKLTAILIRALSQSRKLQTSIEIGGMKPRGITVEIGLSPSVTIKFS